MKQYKTSEFTIREVVEALKEKFPKFDFDDKLWSLEDFDVNDKQQNVQITIVEKEVKLG